MVIVLCSESVTPTYQYQYNKLKNTIFATNLPDTYFYATHRSLAIETNFVLTPLNAPAPWEKPLGRKLVSYFLSNHYNNKKKHVGEVWSIYIVFN